MRRFRPNLALMAFLFLTGVSSVIRCSENARFHDVIGLTTGGFALGAAFVLTILTVMGRISLPDDRKSSDKQRPAAQSSAAPLVGKVD